MRLAKFLATAGVASRRASETVIAAGRVTVNGETVTDPARDVDRRATRSGSTVAPIGAPDGARSVVVYAVNKPAGVVSTAHDPQGRPTVVSLVRVAARLYPVGRLDVDTTGLILLTNDGELAHRLTHPSFEVPKTYRARLDGPPITDVQIRALRSGVTLEDGCTAPARVRGSAARPENTIELIDPRGPQPPGPADVRGRRAPRAHALAGGLRTARARPDLPVGGSRRLSPAEVDALRRASQS